MVDGPKQKACDVCQAVASEMVIVLADPKTVDRATVIITGVVCGQLPSDLVLKVRNNQPKKLLLECTCQVVTDFSLVRTRGSGRVFAQTRRTGQ